MSGLGTDDSDVDMCLLIKSNMSDSRIDAVLNLEQIKDALKNCGKTVTVAPAYGFHVLFRFRS